MAADGTSPLAPEDAARLIEFARACKAAARAVVLYPDGHPAISATLGRIVQVTSPPHLVDDLKLTVLPEGLLLDGRAPARGDAAVGELAALLHSHLIGEILIRPAGTAEAWRQFLLLLGRTPESIRTEGGVARAWATLAGQHIELREIDYAEVLRERAHGESAAWERVIVSCLQGDAVDLTDEAIRELLGVAGDPARLAELMETLEARADPTGGIPAKAAAVMRMLKTIIEAIRQRAADRLDPALRNIAGAVGQLSPDVLMGLLTHPGEAGEPPDLMNAVVSRMSERTIAQFVAKNVIAESSATDRLAQAFQTLVREDDQRQRMLTLAREDVAASPLGNTEGFETVWDHVAEKLLTSYSDETFVSETYGRELSGARTQAIAVEQVSDDPPDRVGAWLSTVATSALRSLDLTLLLDLLRIEQDEERWGELMRPIVALLGDLLLVGDFDAALQLIEVIAREAAPGGTTARRQHAMIAIDMLVAGPMMRHIVTHLGSIDDAQFERVKAMCVSLGEVLIKPLAEALSVEDRPRPQQRLTAILLSFGNVGRRTVERLKTSPNAAVRRTAIHLMREFGGSDALPDLTELIDDNDSQIQREAVSAILSIGTERAYQVLQQALLSGTAGTREAIMRSLSTRRDERATPLLAYILRNIDHRGALNGVYLRAIESLGALRDPAAVAPLTEALYKGDWWAPRRTKALRHAAAAALARIGTPDAFAVLDEAAHARSRAVRAVARAHATRTRRSEASTPGPV
ncbi:MAG TPA: HEAT repeat domain-containing protein [Vicinamibacterales bacterium]